MPVEDAEKFVRKEPLDQFYNVGNELGRGKFAIVKRCTDKSSGEQYASKVLKKRRRGKCCREDILKEIDIMRQANEAADHPRIIRLKEVYESTSEFHLILELATGGELFRLIAKDPLSEDKSREVVYQILDGVKHLHSLNIVHLDLKPENILLYRKGSLDVKIADFGLSVQVQLGQEMKTLVGTAEYVSPEILNFEPLSTFSDMWSIGALTYSLMTGYSPFQGETHQETFLNVTMCDYDFDDEMFDVVSQEAKDFIEKLLIVAPRKRMTALQCMEHSWMKARKSTNLNSSTSSLDSALCMDSASSMEPSPVSSASSSFSPAPSTTTRSTSSTVSTSSSNLSQPEDMKKVNEKLISTLATDRLIADSANKTRGESSPTSTNSSTSTLKGDESAENIPGLVQDVTSNKADANVKRDTLIKKDSTDGSSSPRGSGHSRSFEGPLVITKTYTRETRLSDSEKSPYFERRSKTPLSGTSSINTLGSQKDYLSRSYTVDRRRETISTKPADCDKELSTSYNSSTLGRPSRGLSKQAAEDLLALDPKTIQSLERLKKLTAHKRPKTPEPLAPPLSEVKVQHSPERQRRRKSEGMHPIEKQAGANFKPVEMTLHEGDESELQQEIEEGKKELAALKAKESTAPAEEKQNVKEGRSPVSVSPTPVAKSGGSDRSSSPKSESKVKSTSSDRSSSPKSESAISKRVTSPTTTSRKKDSDVVSPQRTTSPTAVTTTKNDIIESKRTASPVKGYQRSISEKTPSEMERKTTTPTSSSRLTSSRMENGDKSPTPKKRISSSVSTDDTTAKSVPISAYPRSTPVDRMWSDFKKEDSNGSSNKIRTSPRSSRYQQSNSSPSLDVNDSPTHTRRRYVTRERFLEDSGSFKIKPSSSPSGSSIERSPRTSRTSSPTKMAQSKEAEVKSPPEVVTKRTSPTMDKEKDSSTPSRTKSPPTVAINGELTKISPKVEEAVKVADLESSPGVVCRSQNESKGESSKSKDSEDKQPSRNIRVRQKSPVSDRLKVIKANRRKTPVISEDALAAILSGDIPEDDTDECPLSPSQIGERRMTLETCPEEDEGAATTTPTSSPGRKKNILKTSSSFEQGNSAQRTPEKKVTISSEPCNFRRSGKRPMLSAEMRERTKSLTSFSPERSLSPTSPRDYSAIPEEGDNLSKSSNLLSLPKSRLRVSSMVMSRSTPDLSEILEPKRKDRKARRIERSNSKRRVRVDSYVTSTRPNSTLAQSSGSFSAPKSTRRLSGSRFSKFASAFSRKDKDQSEKDSNVKNSEKEKGSKRW